MDVDQVYQVLKQAGALTGGGKFATGGFTGHTGGDVLVSGTANKNISSAAATGNSGGGGLGNAPETLAGVLKQAQQQQLLQQQQQLQQQQPPPDINVINVPEYPERVSRRTAGPLKPNAGGATLPQPPSQQQQQNKGLTAPLADISSSGPNESPIYSSSSSAAVPPPLLRPLIDSVCACLYDFLHVAVEVSLRHPPQQ